jgi:hypothetical protein
MNGIYSDADYKEDTLEYSIRDLNLGVEHKYNPKTILDE